MPYLTSLSFRQMARSAAFGFAAGTLLLGVGGRALMRAIAVATGAPLGFSLGGSLEVVAAGALYGTLAGALLPYLPRQLGPWRSVLHAAGLFLLIALLSDAARGAAANIASPARVFALLSFGALLLGFSVVLVRLTSRHGRHG